MAEPALLMKVDEGNGFPFDPGVKESALAPSSLRILIVYKIMPKGVYDRGPGKRGRGQDAGNLPPRKYGRGNSGSSFSRGSNYRGRGVMRGAQNQARSQPQRSGSASYQRRGFWQKQLIDLGYSVLGDAPNMAVQSVLCLIPNIILHALIIDKHGSMKPGALSPITHLGFSAWVEIFQKLDSKKMADAECAHIINKVFDDCQDILADRTDMDDVLALEFKVGVTFLENTHELLDYTFAVEKEPEKTEMDGTHSQGFTGYIPKEDLDILRKDSEAAVKPISMGDLVILTLHNCQRFPIISEMAIEWLGEEFRHGLWRSQNYSTLAPISMEAWRILGGLDDDQMAEVEYSAINMVKIVDKVEMPYPIGTHFFDKRCLENQGITIFTKAHMGYGGVERGYSYLHRIWRSFSPYFKCNCQACADTITWFDQAVWYTFNHLQELYPKLSQAGRVGMFIGFIQQHLKKPVMAQIAYMKVREMMIKVTNKLATSPKCDLKATFGNTNLVDACELMIKDAEFLAKRFNKNEPSTSTVTKASGSGSVSFLPPRVVRPTAEQTDKSEQTDISEKSESIVNISDSIVTSTPGEASVTKGANPKALQMNIDGRKGKLTFG